MTKNGQSGLAGTARDDMAAPSALQRALRTALEREANHLGHRFFGDWHQTRNDLEGPVPELVWKRCTQQDRPLDGLVWIGDTVRRLDWLAERRQRLQVATPVIELVELMTLVLWERRILEMTAQRPADEGVPVLPLNAPLAASLIASAWLNVPARISLDDRGRLCVLNTLADARPSEWGRDPTRAVRAEIGAFLHAYGDVGQARGYDAFRRLKHQRMLHMQQDPDGGVPSAALLQVRLGLHRQQGGPDPIVVARADGDDTISRATCLWLRDTLQIASFQTACPDGPPHGLSADVVEALETLRGDISDTLQQIFSKLHPSDKDTDMTKAKVFISYSHADKEWLERVKLFLGQLEDKGQLEIWEDTKIGTGDEWRKQIDDALSSCTIAVLLLSINFARSRFIKDEEMPRIWERRKNDGVEIYPILVKNFPWEEDTNLARIQIKMHEGKALNKLSEDECDDALTAISREISRKLKVRGAAA